jgi:hypothetical protein
LVVDALSALLEAASRNGIISGLVSHLVSCGTAPTAGAGKISNILPISNICPIGNIFLISNICLIGNIFPISNICPIGNIFLISNI